ncbi:MAG: anti-sigma factor [Acidobacteria bacterium]|nr:anti-sigma factor [Acidobacteriota bacterium]
MMNCREVSTAVSFGPLSEQPTAVRIRAWLHLMMCRHCRRFWRQIRALDRGVRAALRGYEEEMPPDLPRRVADRLSGRRPVA